MVYANTTVVDDAFESFGDIPEKREIVHPDWFKHSFLDFREDLKDVKKQGKKGLVVYFGQENCAYCEAMMEADFGDEKIVAFFRKNFDIVAIDIWGSRPVVTLEGTQTEERELALTEGTNFTPSLIFYDIHGNEALRLRGYYPPYKFFAALQFVAGEFYLQERFSEYLDRAQPPPKFDEGELNEAPFFVKQPYVLDRSDFVADEPLAVFFERKNCHSCDVLHSAPLEDDRVMKLLSGFEVVQLDVDSDTPVLSPIKKATTAKQWADELDIFFTPTIVFFNGEGSEVFRIDSVVKLYRLRGILEYVKSKGYEVSPTYLRWREDYSTSVQ